MASLSEDDQSRVRYYLGYSLAQESSVIGAAGSPIAVGIENKLEFAMSHLRDQAIPRIQALLATLDKLEKIMGTDALCRLRARSVDNVELNNKELDQLERQYLLWKRRLGDALGVKLFMSSYASGLQPGSSGSMPRTIG
jgi:hypothetical protein